MRWLLASALCLVGLLPVATAQAKKEKKDPPKIDGRLIVEDGAGFFTPEAIRRAKGILSEARDIYPREMLVMSLRDLSEAKIKEYEKLADSSAKERFFSEIAHEEARASKARGVFVLICRKPSHLIVLADKDVRDKGFAGSDEQRVRDVFVERFREGSKQEKEEEKRAIFDKALISAAEYVRDSYKKMVK
jgi:hypothetical protein